MSAAPKKLSDKDRTLEIVLPEHITKSRIIPKPNLEVAPVPLSLHDTSESFVEKKQGEIHLPETTLTIENLGLEFEHPISTSQEKNLPKPEITHSPIQNMMQEQQSKTHDDLKKVAHALFQETKKIIPLNQDLRAEIIKLKEQVEKIEHVAPVQVAPQSEYLEKIHETQSMVAEIKNELASLKALEGDKNVVDHICELNEVIKECTNNLKSDYQNIVHDVQNLQNEKMSLSSTLSQLENHLKSAVDQKNDATKFFNELQSEIKEKEKSLRDLEDKNIRINDAVSIFPSLLHEITDFKCEKERLTLEIHALTQSARHLEAKISFLEAQFQQRKKMLDVIGKDFLEEQDFFESVRQQKIDLHKQCADEQIKLSLLKAELAAMQLMKANQDKMRDEDTFFYKEKKEYLYNETQEAENKYKSRLMELEIELEKKKTEWDIDLVRQMEKREVELKSNLQLIQLSHVEEWNKNHQRLLDEICRATKDSVTENEQRNGIDQILHDFFNRKFSKT